MKIAVFKCKENYEINIFYRSQSQELHYVYERTSPYVKKKLQLAPRLRISLPETIMIIKKNRI
jgi:hypothetical protein